MKILVLGQSGQVATALAQSDTNLPVGWSIENWGRGKLNLEDTNKIFPAILGSKAGAIINAAAYTLVDKAETEAEQAQQINAIAPEQVALAAQILNVPLIHISTDYVFSGEKRTAYTETDRTAPLGIYGATKAEGESLVLNAYSRATVLRTSWVFHESGNNFVKTMLNLSSKKSELHIVSDQHGSPTYAGDIASACLEIVKQAAPGSKSAEGIFHFSSAGHTTWYTMAQQIFTTAADLGCKVPENVIAIETKDYPVAARRPLNSCLDCSKIQREFGIDLRDWRASVVNCVTRIVEGGRAKA